MAPCCKSGGNVGNAFTRVVSSALALASLNVRSTTPYWNGKLLNPAFCVTGPPSWPLKLPGASGCCAPLLCARSPVTGFDTSWHVPHISLERMNCDCSAGW